MYGARLARPLALLAFVVLASTALAHHPVTTSGGASAFFWAEDASGTTQHTDYTTVQADSQGGIHMTYTLLYGSQPRPAIYAYCPANCGVPSNWSRVALGYASGEYASVSWAQLELDRTVTPNRPRVLLQSINPAYGYAACDASCTNPASWTITPLINQSTGGYEEQSHSFALDQQGRPHFAVFGNLDAGRGTWYYSCSASCTNAGNWTAALIFPGFEPRHPTLAVTPQGHLGLLDYFYDTENKRHVLDYNVCSANCSDSASWSYVYIATLGTRYQSFRLRYDSQGRPRIAIFPGTELAGTTFSVPSLYYLWCDTNCTTASSWSWKQLLNQANPANPDPNLGMDPDLVLDDQDRPSMSADGSHALLFISCAASCQSPAGSWSVSTVETSDELNSSHPVTPISPYCQKYPTWALASHTSVAVTPDGVPVLGYTAEHLSLCDSPPRVTTNITWARVAIGGSQDGGSGQQVYIPLLRR